MHRSAASPAVLAAALSLALLAAAAAPAAAQSSDDLRDALRRATQRPAPTTPSSTPATSVSQADAASGLREALAQGAQRGIRELGRADGFWGNDARRIPLPRALQRVEPVLRQAGQGARIDEFHLSMNRAAERAVPAAAEVIGDAVRRMSFDDARAILTGGDDAATQYLRRTAGPALAERFRPIVAQATGEVGATRQYRALTQREGVGAVLGALGGSGASSAADLDGYVTDKALDALFAQIADEERAIRRDPVKRGSELLRRVFGR